MEEEVETFAGSSPLEMEAVGSRGGVMGCTITTTRIRGAAGLVHGDGLPACSVC